MYSAHNEGQSVIAERFVKTLKVNIYNKMIANNSKSYLSYLNILAEQYSNTYHHSVNKNILMLIILFWLEKTETNPKAPKFKVNHRVRITKNKNIFSKGYTENWL